MELIQSTTNSRWGIVLCLDHNLDLLKADLHNNMKEFLELNAECNMWPIITRPTRITKSSATLIDNILIDSKLLDSYYCGILLDDISDHMPCLLGLKGAHGNPKEVWITSRKINNKALDRIKIDLMNNTPLEDITNKPTSVAFDSYHDFLCNSIDKEAPMINRVVKNKKIRCESWVTNGILRSIKKQKKLYIASTEKNATGNTIEKYKRYRNCLTKIKRQCKIDYYNKKCIDLKNNSKKLWLFVNQVTKKCTNKTDVIEYLQIDKKRIDTPNAISNCLGDYFSKIGKNLASTIKDSQTGVTDYNKKIPLQTRSLFLEPTTAQEIDLLIRKLPNKASSGYNNINNLMLKELRNEICHPLSLIFNKSLASGEFPEAMKFSDTVPLYKNKSKHERSNYRPISLLLTLSKLLEKIMYVRTYNFLTHTEQINKTQYGFRKHHSCEHAVEELISNVLKNKDQGRHTLVIYLDLSKAFDSLPHEILFDKLYRYGIRGNCLEWFKSYLKNRQLRVKCKTATSNETVFSNHYEVNFGTPQGSNLGPLLFLIFVNDLSNQLELCNTILFADDTTLYKGHTNLRYLYWCMNRDLAILNDWFHANKLTLNISKTVYMLFTNGKVKPDKEHEIQISNEKVNRVQNMKFLGVRIDDNLNWNHQYNHVVLKLKRNMHLLRDNKLYLNRNTKKLIYYAHIYSHISYCIVVWGNMLSKQELKKLQKLQNKCIDLIDSRQLNRNKKYHENKLLKIDEIIMLENEKLGYKLIKTSYPIIL